MDKAKLFCALAIVAACELPETKKVPSPPFILITGVNVYFHPAGYAPYYDATTGIYHAEEEPENWVQAELGQELLVIIMVLIVENMEGIDCPHGPYAQLYILIHHVGDEPADLNHWTSKQINKKAVYGYDKYHLKGPLSGKDSWELCYCVGITFLDLCFDVKCWTSYGKNEDGTAEFDSNVEEEWVDNLYVKYPVGKAGIYQWEEGEEEIYITLRESDGEPKFDRVDDYMGLSLVSKEATKAPCGMVVPLYKYDNTKEDKDPDNNWDFDPGGTGAFHYPTGVIGGYLWLKTFTCNNKPGNPC